MARGLRRYVKHEEDESEDEALPPMSPNTRKEHQLKLIQRMDLCEENADAIKTSEIPRGGSRLFMAPSITPECKVEGTEAARIANANKEPTSRWQTFGQSDEAVDALFTQKQIGNGNTHRRTIEELKREQEERLGHKLSLEDTYNDSGRGRQGGRRVTSLYTRPPSASVAQSVPSMRPSSAAPKESASSKRGKGAQAMPWPPPGLEGTPSMALAMQINQPSTKITTTKMSAMPESPRFAVHSADPKRRALTHPAKSHSFNLVEDSSQFMSSIQSKLTAFSHSTQTEAPGTSTSAANVAQPTLASLSTEPVAQPQHTSAGHLHLHDSSILRVPVAELSFSVANTLAPGNVSTHTDGVPSPAALSIFSTSTADDRESSTRVQAVTSDLVGLGIEDTTLLGPRSTTEVLSGGGATQASPLSPSGSILDSPILDKVSSEVLSADPAKVVIIGGRRYVLESELLNLKEAVGKQLSRTTTSVSDSSSHGPVPKAVLVPQPSLASSTVAGSIAPTAVRASRPANPFGPREPLATNDANIAAAQVSSSIVNKDTGVGPSTAAKPATRPSSVVTSNTTIISKWADDPSSRPAARPPAPVIRSSSPIFGDRKVFGRLSKEAAEGDKYDPLPPPARRTTTTKRSYLPPGPGLTRLLKEMADAGQKGPAANETEEEL